MRQVTCTYTTQVTTAILNKALKEENETLQLNCDSLQQILHLLRSSSDEESADLVRLLKKSPAADPSTLLQSMRVRQQEEDLENLGLTRGAGAPSQTSVEFHLMLRYSVAYPALAAPDLPPCVLGTSQLRWPKAYEARAPDTTWDQETRTSCANAAENIPNATVPGPSLESMPAPVALADHPAEAMEDGPAVYQGDRLRCLDIKRWTTVAVSNDFVIGALRLFLETDQPFLGIFDVDLFIDDLVAPRARFCSPLLVNALLCWACQSYTSVVPQAVVLGDAFFLEADQLWSTERQTDSLPTIMAAQLLTLSSIYHGRDGGMLYLSQGIQMAQRLNLFGPPEGITLPAASHEHPDEWLRMLSCTAWSLFNLATMRSLQFQGEGLSIIHPPLLPIPRPHSGHRLNNESSDYKPFDHYTIPDYSTFTALCEFWVITSSWVQKYYGNTVQETRPTPISEEFAISVHHQLLGWSDKLPAYLARGDQCRDYNATMHIFLHVSILNIFRPFTKHFAQPKHVLADPLEECANYSTDVFEASLCQLKHMVRVFDCKYPSSSYGILWHSGLLHVANAMLMAVDAPESLQYFMLCIACYRDLSPSYRVVYAIVKGLLAIAWEKGLVSSGRALATLTQLQTASVNHANLDDIRATFMIDLSAGLVNTKESQVEALAERFDAIGTFGELTAGTDYLGSSPPGSLGVSS